MELTNSHVIQAVAAIVLSIFIYVLALKMPGKITLGALILLIPFQVIDSRYGSINVVLIYIAALAFLARGDLRRLPLFVPFLILIAAYTLSLGQVPSGKWFFHVIYLISLASNILLFYMVYNLALESGDWRYFRNLLVVQNILIAIYSVLQLGAGYNDIKFFGISEFQMNENREDGRLVGPFKATGVMVEYLAIQIFILSYALLRDKKIRYRAIYISLIFLNIFFMIASGNRGGIVTLVLGAMGFVVLFGKEMGYRRVLGGGIVAAILLTGASYIVIEYTNFNTLYERLGETEIEGGVPDTRSITWPQAINKFNQSPILGSGPYYKEVQDANNGELRYPHSLYLFVPVTLGISGSLAYLIFFYAMATKIGSPWREQVQRDVISGLPKLGILILCIFFVSEIRIEMLRFKLTDYQHYLFVLFGVLAAFSDRLRTRETDRRVVIAPSGLATSGPMRMTLVK
ncbi:MAG: O-antigen ligase family protein [Gammaproteobacteria bacterium]|jgi:hypothetical protein|nr:O-antigen ligase family protein [Gammaproteobacteria bacterium]